jgi:hypothetical protein
VPIIAVPVGALTATGTTNVLARRILPGIASLGLSGQLLSVNRFTTITGSIYDAATGAKRTLGRLYLKPNNFLRNGSNLVIPKTVTYDIPGSGNLSLVLAPSTDGITYTVEFDPTPADTTIPFRIKSGYFKDEWSIPASTSVDIATL